MRRFTLITLIALLVLLAVVAVLVAIDLTTGERAPVPVPTAVP